MAHKLFRDPLYDYIQIDEGQSWLLGLINTPELQRLRYISHLGMSHVTYPGSNHSRFSHSLGVLHLMQRCVSHLKQGNKRRFEQLDEEALLAAALLHDIGHGPFSHATEDIFGDHEVRSVHIISSVKSGVNQVLGEVDKELPSKVAALIAKKPEKDVPQPVLWQKSLISSQLDMDRLDYLRRDALCSGAGYGNFDWFRILHTMELNEAEIEDGRKDIFVTWPNKSRFALEEYVFSRFYMYQSVYYHHTTRGFESLLRRVLERARDLATQDKSFAKSLLPPMKTLLGEGVPEDIQTFLDLNDHVLIAQITMWRRDARDKILSDLAERLLLRKGLGWEEQPGGLTSMEMHAKISEIEEYLEVKGLDPRYYFIEDKAEMATYRPYRSTSSSGEQSSVNSIMLFDPMWSGADETGFKEISRVPGLQRLKAITDEGSSILRYYFPKEHESAIKRLLR